jgi:hypothetical protein
MESKLRTAEKAGLNKEQAQPFFCRPPLLIPINPETLRA